MGISICTRYTNGLVISDQGTLGVPLVKGGQNLPPMVGIWLTDMPNIGCGGSDPPGPPVPASLDWV